MLRWSSKLSPRRVSRSLLAFAVLLLTQPALTYAGSATLSWDPNTESDLAGYNVYTGTTSGVYGTPTPVGTATTHSVTGLQDGMTHFFAVTAFDTSGNESGPSNEVSKTLPPPAPDTTPPTVTLTSPPSGTLSGTVTVAANATDDVGVVGVQFELDGAPLGSEDTSAPYSFIWNTGSATNASHTLTAVARDAAGNTTTSTALAITIDNTGTGTLVISNLTVANGKSYEVVDSGLTSGALAYIDRTFTFTTVPGALQSATYIKTANDDKSATDAGFLSFDVNLPVTVYVGYDQRITTKPAWILPPSFTDTGLDLVTSDTTFDVFSQAFPAGTVTLGGNSFGNSMYTVIVVPGGTPPPPDTTAPSTPTGFQATAVSSAQINLSWTASTDDVGVTGYTIRRDGSVLTTISTTNYSDTGLTASTTYSYTVTASDAAGNESPAAGPASATTSAATDATAPSVSITTPTTGSTWTATGSVLNLGGTASDNVGVTQVTWQNNRGGSGTAAGTTSWSITGINLVAGSNVLTVTAHDAAGNTTSKTLTVTFNPPDTTPPSVALTSPADGASVSGTITLAATAADNIGVVGVQFQVDGANAGAEDTTNTYSVSFDTSGLTDGAHTVTAIARDAAGNTTTATPATVTVSNGSGTGGGSLTVSNVTATSGKTYQVVDNGLASGALTYIDRSYTFTSIPSTLQNATYIKTANDDKSATGASFLSFDINTPATVYVAYDRRISSSPTWLTTFTDTGLDMVSTDTTFDVYAKSFPAGTVTLGGNSFGNSMYTVAVSVPDTEAPSQPTNLGATRFSATQVILMWNTSTDNIGVTNYTIYKDGTAIGTVTKPPFADGDVSPGATGMSYTVSAQDGAGNESLQSDAVTVTDVTPALADFITGLYQLVLERNPATAEVDGWTAFIQANPNTGGFSSMVHGFLDSPEFQTHAITPSQNVEFFYQAIMGRKGDSAGLAAWTAALVDRYREIRAGFINSPEFQSRFPNPRDPATASSLVTSLYVEVLGRAPQSGEEASWVNHLVATGDLASVVNGFFDSPEFLNQPRTLAAYVTTVYRAILARDPASAEVDGWVAQLVSRRAELEEGFIQSQEFQNRIQGLLN